MDGIDGRCACGAGLRGSELRPPFMCANCKITYPVESMTILHADLYRRKMQPVAAESMTVIAMSVNETIATARGRPPWRIRYRAPSFSDSGYEDYVKSMHQLSPHRAELEAKLAKAGWRLIVNGNSYAIDFLEPEKE